MRQGSQRHPFSCFFSKEKIQRSARPFAQRIKIGDHMKQHFFTNLVLGILTFSNAQNCIDFLSKVFDFNILLQKTEMI